MIFMSDGCRLSFPPVSSLSIPVLQPEKNTKVAVMHHKCHSYLPGSPATPQTDRLVEHRNSTPAIHLKMEITSDSLTSLTPRTRTRHGTWSHCQQQESRARATSVSRSTQTNSDNWEGEGEEAPDIHDLDQDDGLYLHKEEVTSF